MMETEMRPLPAVGKTRNVSPHVLQLVKAQRRVRGVVAEMEGNSCIIESTYGRFAFDPRSVKANRNHPDRQPQVGDPCEFRLSHQTPPKAVSIRVAVPKKSKTASDDFLDEYTIIQCNKLLEDLLQES
ncbi:hypothetical protein DIPPA_32746 [Diplonema papillatum]|nr:hypothetical protein DIPPA_32746 [Diplonema papillatum]